MTAEAYLARLGERGIDYVFANAGTDFAPIVEAISRHGGNGAKYPRFLTVPHENVAMAMAHGYYRTCGKQAAVMVHVTVGTANAIFGLMNARDNVRRAQLQYADYRDWASPPQPLILGPCRRPGRRCPRVLQSDELRDGQPVDAWSITPLDIAMTGLQRYIPFARARQIDNAYPGAIPCARSASLTGTVTLHHEGCEPEPRLRRS
jgi:acetolactate synthase-1/2/3 large subunit